ncbi:MAG: nuclease-related domain-containing protein [Sulfurimicrobium sp.]|nr:nuclease-related domain-containing protein [Sulfurimicrobium sp.]
MIAIQILIPFFISFGTIYLVIQYVMHKTHQIKQRGRSPLTKKLLRSPGESIRNKLESIHDDLIMTVSMITIIPISMYSIWAFNQTKQSAFIAISIGLISIIYLTKSLLKKKNEQQRLTVGLEAEMATGQELNQLMMDGYHVFHDLQLQDNSFNIDHVIVGPGGVYAVETKGRSKPINAKGKAEWEIECKGDTLIFPGWEETKPIEQARFQARELQKWICAAIAEPIVVQPALRIHGWNVKGRFPKDVKILYGNPRNFFARGQKTLEQETIKRIAFQLEQKCRDVEPTSHSITKPK